MNKKSIIIIAVITILIVLIGVSFYIFKPIDNNIIEDNNIIDSELEKPEVKDPEITKPEVKDPEITKPEVKDPELTNPGATKPEEVKPELTKPETVKPEATKPNNVVLKDLMKKLYDGISQDNLPMMISDIVLTNENKEYYLGSANIEFEEALASESGITSVAHSIVLVKAKEGQDVEKLKAEIKSSVNPRKWICIGVEEVIVKSKGNIIVVILNDNLGEQFISNFNKSL